MKIGKVGRLGLSLAVASLFFVGCGGGSSGASTVTSSSNSANGNSNKGPFKKDSNVTARQIDISGNYTGKEVSTTTSDDKGSYSVTPSWTGITEIRITGEYLNEATGVYMKDGNISAIVDMNGPSSPKINIFTEMASKIIMTKIKNGELQNGKSFAQIKDEAKELVQKQFNLKLDKGTKLEDLDLTSKEHEANTQLLKVSAALMQTADPKKALDDLAEDMSDGSVDESGLGVVKEIQEKARTVDIQEVAQKIKENVKDVKVDVPDDENVLDGTLSLDSTISFNPVTDALPSIDKIVKYSAENTIDGVIGDSADITVENANFTVNGKVVSKVSNGDVLKVFVDAPTEYNSTKEAKITIGGTLFKFAVTTKAQEKAKDITPDDFDLGFKSDVDIGSSVDSKEVDIKGIDDNTSISVENGELYIDGIKVSSNTTINSGQKVKVTTTAPANMGETKIVKLTVGSVTKKFVVITKQEDKLPDPVSFASLYDAALDQDVLSDTIAVSGINVPIDAKVENGTFADGSTIKTVQNGDTLQLKVHTPNKHSDDAGYEPAVAKLILGDMVVPFKVVNISGAQDDIVPNQFSFSTKYTNDRDSYVESETITISGMTPDLNSTISIKGGEYSINGEAFTSQEGVVRNGEQVKIRVKSADYAKEAKATLTIGGKSADFVVFTKDDQIPEPVVFEPVIDANLSTVYRSNVVTIKGLSHPVPISIEGDGATFEVNGANSDTVQNDDNVTISLESSSSEESAKSAKLKVGKSVFSFTVKTKAPKPDFGTISSKVAKEDRDFTYILTPEKGEVNEWKVISKPDWIDFDDRSGALGGVPSNSDVGDTNVTLEAINASGKTTLVLPIKVENVNDAPAIADINTTVRLDENNASSITIPLSVTDEDTVWGDSVTLSVVPTSSPYLDINLTDTNLTLSMIEGALGHQTKKLPITVIAKDSEGLEDKKVINLTLVGKNNKPVILGVNLPDTLHEDDQPISVKVNASDKDGDKVSFKVSSSNPERAKVEVTSDGFKLIPQKDANGEVIVDVTPNDGIDDGQTLHFQTYIAPVNDVPVLAPITHPDIDEDSPAIHIDLNATDIDSQNLTYSIVSISDNNLVEASISGKTLVITPKPNAFGKIDIQVKANDGSLDSNIQTLSLNIKPINDAPIANPDTDSTDNKTALTIDVLANDSDIDGDKLSIKSVTTPNSGTAQIQNGKILFTPNQADTNTTVTFGYVITDGKLDANSSVTISIGEYKSGLAKALDSLDNFDPATDDIDAKINEVKSKLNEAGASDKEAQLGLAVIELAEVFNSSEVESLINVDLTNSSISYTDYLPKLLKGISDDNSGLEVMLKEVNDLSGVSTDILHELSQKLINIAQKINAIYTSDSVVVKIGDKSIDKPSADLIMASALVVASQLEYMAAYHYVDYDDVKLQKSNINGQNVEYRNIDIDPVSVLNKQNTFTISSSARLSAAKTILLTSIDILEQLDSSKLSGEDKQDIDELKAKLPAIKTSLNGGANFVIESQEYNHSEKLYFDLSALYNPATAISKSTLSSEYIYHNVDGNPAVIDLTKSKLAGYPVDANGQKLEVVPKTKPSSATSNIDKVLTKVDIIRDGLTTSFTGDDIYGYLFSDVQMMVTPQDSNSYIKQATIVSMDDNAPYIWTLKDKSSDSITINVSADTKIATIDPTTATGDVWYTLIVEDKYGHTAWFHGYDYIDDGANSNGSGDDNTSSNQAPQIELSNYNIEVPVNESASISVNVTDPDSTEIRYRLAENNTPSFVTLGYETDSINITPTSDDVNFEGDIIVEATDGENNVSKAFHLKVVAENSDSSNSTTNTPPAIELSTTSVNAYIGQEKIVTVNVTDPDNDPVTLSLGSNTPDYVTLDIDNNQIHINPSDANDGEKLDIKVLANDGTNTSESTFRLHVSKPHIHISLQEPLQSGESYDSLSASSTALDLTSTYYEVEYDSYDGLEIMKFDFDQDSNKFTAQKSKDGGSTWQVDWSADYVTADNKEFTMSVNGVDDGKVKYLSSLTYSDLNAILPGTFQDGDFGYKFVFHKLTDEYDWYGDYQYKDWDAKTQYSSLEEFVNDTKGTKYWQCLGYDCSNGGITFAPNSDISNGSGTLVFIENGTITNDNAGSWEVKNIDGKDTIITDITVDGYIHNNYFPIFKFDGTGVAKGDIEKAGSENVFFWLNDTANEHFISYINSKFSSN